MVVVNAQLFWPTIESRASLGKIAYSTQAVLQFEHCFVHIVRGIF